MTPTSTPAISEREPRHNGERGFTLIELALVLLIVGVLVTVAVPRLPSLTGVRLESEARNMAVRMAYLADEAALRGRVYRMRLDLDTDTYDTAALTPYAENAEIPTFQPSWDPLAAPVRLNDTIDLRTFESTEGQWDSGQHAIYFFPEGAARGAVVGLTRADGSERTEVHLDEGTGEVRVLDAFTVAENAP